MYISYIIHIIFFTIIATTIILLILENRNAVKTTAWIIVLIAFPIFGFIAYLFIGRNYKIKKISKLKQKNTAYTNFNNSEDTGRIERMAEALGDFPVRGFSSLDIYTDGNSLFSALKKDILSARFQIDLEYYILDNDEIGNDIISLLKQKANSGIKVRIMVDDLGSWHLTRKIKKEISDAGISITSCLKVSIPFLTSHLNYRNHRKIALFDGHIAYMGGMNIADRYIKGLSWGSWRDTHFRITGEVYADLQQIFDEDLYLLGGIKISEHDIINASETPNIGKVQIVKSGPDLLSHPIMKVYHKMIMSAKHTIEIQTPYFMPNETIREALICAAKSGVEVYIMIPLKCDERFVMMGSYSYIDELVAAGCHFYFYKKGFLHSKTLNIDHTTLSIGSANLDFRSLEHNFELTAIFYDKFTAEQHSMIFAKDILDCEKLDIERWNQRSQFMKFKESIARLFSPLF